MVEDMSPPFFADGPSGDLVAASFNLQFAAAAMTGIVEMHVQKVHSLNSQFREQNAAIRESAGEQRFPSNKPRKAIHQVHPSPQHEISLARSRVFQRFFRRPCVTFHCSTIFLHASGSKSRKTASHSAQSR